LTKKPLGKALGLLKRLLTLFWVCQKKLFGKLWVCSKKCWTNVVYVGKTVEKWLVYWKNCYSSFGSIEQLLN
jgi:hypothetical protein